MSQNNAMYEVVSLQREAERNSEERERVTSPNEEDVDEGMVFFYVFIFVKDCVLFSSSFLYFLLFYW